LKVNEGSTKSADSHVFVVTGQTAKEAAEVNKRYLVEQAKQTIAIEVGADVRPFVDERAFKQILLNLLSNAIKFSPDGGAIGVSCRSGPDGAVLLCVADCGPGIPEEKIRTLFRPFSRVDNRYDRSENGTGLGLALVHGLVGLHDGRVWLRNKVGGGLEVFVEFSAREARAA